MHAHGHAVPIAEVTQVWHARGPGSVRTRSRLLGRGILIFLLSIPPLVGVVCVVSLAWSAQDRGAWRLAAIVLAACVVGALFLTPFLELPLTWLDRSYDRGSSVHELWIRYHGREIMLLSTSDALRFGQIYRAVERAVERGDR